uniref:Biogenesis of lysosome-related organelles complex 1 subunit 3 n=1 Tax=Caenorhabditis japonica TaxID=281687 RepID=A0A8R1HPD1_CAEJA
MTSAFDGEAPETDDEIDEEPQVSRQTPLETRDAEKRNFQQFPIDKTLKKRWSQAAGDSINICLKRTAPAEKTMQKVTESAVDCFTSMQNVAAKLNVIHANVARLEDSVADLVDAAKLIPSTFPVYALKIPEFL